MDITINIGLKSYPVVVGKDLLNLLGVKVSQLGFKKVLLVTDSNVGPLYLKTAKQSLIKEGLDVAQITLPAGEIYKTVAAIELIWEKALESGLDRQSGLIALGGGVVGDLTGFTAATFLRGIGFIQVPTTLLSQVDASVGGKTGFNLRQGKNLVGAFYQPQAVIADIVTLMSLPEREYYNGYAEIVKHGLIIPSSGLLDFLDENKDKVLKREATFLTELVKMNVAIKASIVTQDEKEKGLRSLLNLGHTAGHALEEIGSYKTYYHGEAVAIGLLIACSIALERGLLNEKTYLQVKNLLQNLNLPLRPFDDIDPKIWWEKTFSDKKSASGIVYWVLPTSDYQALYGQKVDFAEFRKAIASLRKGD